MSMTTKRFNKLIPGDTICLNDEPYAIVLSKPRKIGAFVVLSVRTVKDDKTYAARELSNTCTTVIPVNPAKI